MVMSDVVAAGIIMIAVLDPIQKMIKASMTRIE